MSYSLIDIGANLAHHTFDEDRSDVMQRAAEAGVDKIIVTGSSDASNVQAAELAANSAGVLFSTAGVHPHHASDYTDHSDALIRSLIQKDVVVAVGECGLDYFRDLSPREAQLSAFRRQLDIARDSGLPVFLPVDATWTRIDEWVELAGNRGHRFGVADLLIGAIAADRQLPLWSLDDDFDRMARLGLLETYRFRK